MNKFWLQAHIKFVYLIITLIRRLFEGVLHVRHAPDLHAFVFYKIKLLETFVLRLVVLPVFIF